jgi:KDO2-lipid IV(A) lauroyltransferase
MKSQLAASLIAFLSHLPRRLVQRVGSLAGWLNYVLDSRSAKVTRANIELCFPSMEADEVRVLTQSSLQETGKTLMETPAVWLAGSDRLTGWISSVENETILTDALAADGGVLILLPHVGNWEMFNIFFRRYGQMTALYQPPKQDSMKALMSRLRSRHGNEMVPTTTRGLARLYKTLTRGGNVVVLPDQVPGQGHFTPFFGHPALTDELSFRLLRKTGSTAVGVVVLREPGGSFKVHCLAPDDGIYSNDVQESLASVNRLVEHCASFDFAQYQWEYKRFRQRPAGAEKIYRFHKPPGVHN